MIVSSFLFGLIVGLGPSPQDTEIPESTSIYLEDKRTFEQLLADNDVDGAMIYFRAKAEACEQTFGDLTCPYYWGDLQSALSDLSRSEDLEYVRTRYVRALQLAMTRRGVPAAANDPADALEGLKRAFDNAGYGDPVIGDSLAREIIALLPEDDPRWLTWLGDIARFYHAIDRSNLALIIERKRLAVLLASGSAGNSLPYIAMAIADLQLENGEYADAARHANLALGALGPHHAARIVALLHLGEALSGMGDRAEARASYQAAGELAESLGRAQDWQHICRRLVRTASDLEYARYASSRAAIAQEERIERSGGFDAQSASLIEAGRDNRRCLVQANWLLYRGPPDP